MDPNDKKIEEVAKAAAALAKFGTKTVQTTEKILKFSAKVLKQPIDDTSGIIGDRLRLFRWERQVSYVDKVNKILDDRNVNSTRPVAPKFALPILENASLEENDDLQTLWANLMANAMDPNFSDGLRIAYIEIIKNLTTLDAKLLKIFYDSLLEDSRVNWDKILDYSLTKEQLMSKLDITAANYELSIFNLFRNQCLAPAVITSQGISLGGHAPTSYKGSKQVTLTPLGVSFINSCM